MKVYAVGDELKNLSALADFNLPWATEPAGAQRSSAALVPFVAYLHRAVFLRANALASVPWSISRESAAGPLLWDSEEPNPPDELKAFASLGDLLARTEQAMVLSSCAYWHKERNRVRVTGLRWLDPETTAPHWTPRGISHFERSANGGTARLAPEDVVYFRALGTSETEPAAPPAQAAAAAANVLYNTAEFARMFFARGAIKAGLLTVDGTPLPAERERLKSWWQRFIGGLGNAYSAEVVSAAVKYVPVGEGLADLAHNTLTQEQREDIATALGVPHSLIISNASNFATAQQDSKTFYETTIVPECRLIERQVNQQLFAPLGLRFRYLPDALDVFQQDAAERATAFASYVNAGLLPSIAAQMLSMELPEGVEYEHLDRERPRAPLFAGVPSPGGRERDDDALEAERKRFVRWARKRGAPDVSAFKSDLLSDDEKGALLGETGGRFPAGWGNYP